MLLLLILLAVSTLASASTSTVIASGVAVDFTINFGNLLTIFMFLTGGLSFVFLMRNQISLISQDNRDMRDEMKGVKDELKKLTEIMILQGRMEERITAMDQRQVAMDQRQVQHGKRLDDVVRRVNVYLDMQRINIPEEPIG